MQWGRASTKKNGGIWSRGSRRSQSLGTIIYVLQNWEKRIIYLAHNLGAAGNHFPTSTMFESIWVYGAGWVEVIKVIQGRLASQECWYG